MDDQDMWGAVPEAALQRIAVVSPHFDDAALGAAHLLSSYPGTTVITVCGGPPESYPDEPTDWDTLGGFVAGDDIVAIRREEDRAAMSLVDATPIWLDFVDWQYLGEDERAAPLDVATALEAALATVAPTAVFLPMGVANPDHVLTHDAGRLVLERRPEIMWFAYEDNGYKHIPGLLAWRISKLFHSGLWPTPANVPVQPDLDRKRRVINCYRSQLAPLERDHGLRARLDGNVPEQHWRLAPPPAGWEALVEV